MFILPKFIQKIFWYSAEVEFDLWILQKKFVWIFFSSDEFYFKFLEKSPRCFVVVDLLHQEPIYSLSSWRSHPGIEDDQCTLSSWRSHLGIVALDLSHQEYPRAMSDPGSIE